MSKGKFWAETMRRGKRKDSKTGKVPIGIREECGWIRRITIQGGREKGASLWKITKIEFTIPFRKQHKSWLRNFLDSALLQVDHCPILVRFLALDWDIRIPFLIAQ
jgi:hypothetical protein